MSAARVTPRILLERLAESMRARAELLDITATRLQATGEVDLADHDRRKADGLREAVEMIQLELEGLDRRPRTVAS